MSGIEVLKTIINVLTFDDFEPGQWNSIIRSCNKFKQLCTQKMNNAGSCVLKKTLPYSLQMTCIWGSPGIFKKRLHITSPSLISMDQQGFRRYWGANNSDMGFIFDVSGLKDAERAIVQKYTYDWCKSL